MIDELDRRRVAPEGSRSAQRSPVGARTQRQAPTSPHEAQRDAGAFAVEWGSPEGNDVDER